MQTALWILALIATVTVASVIAQRLGAPAPLLLVVIGIGASFLPFVEPFELSPELVLVGLLPPLLYSASIRTSLVDISANRRSIAWLAVGLVVATPLIVGFVAWLLIPIPLAAAFAFGAVVAPPDAVAATAIARRIGLPRRIVTVLEGESLLNDATALVALRTAIVAVGATVSLWGVTLDFVWAAAGGAVIGFAVALLLSLVRRKVSDPLIDCTISFMAPFLAYLPAEELHASGVIAVVTAGLVLGHKAPIIQNATSRMNERINWETIQFLLENTVFLLIGLQVRRIVDSLGATTLSFWTIAGFCAGVLVTVILVRPLWVFPVGLLLIRPRGSTDEAFSWRSTAVVSWAGMRGVVTLAAAFVIPASVPNVQVLVLGAFVVTAGTLLIQGLSLPWLARTLQVRGPDAREDALQEATVLQAAVEAGRHELDRIVTDRDDEDVVRVLRARGESRLNQVWERLGDTGGDEPPSEQYRRLRTAMLAAERAAVLKIRKAGEVDSEVLTGVMEALDVEESMIDRREARAETDLERTLVTPEPAANLCADLDAAPLAATPQTPDGCADCFREGTRWVHLRLCLTCGNVGCCDSSVGRHATRHFNDTAHPVMRSFEPGEAWRWCYVHEVLG
ncbi:Na+/H+ antiporter [Nakamurella sp.]|uniref:Na+/H+ antiporter n=1 Tax=Nakamurella sp. TaxID=1869182 RepID=UPI003B3BDA9D